MSGDHEGSMYKKLKHIIPTATAFGGAILGLLLVAADLSGAIRSRTSILMAVTIIYSCKSILIICLSWASHCLSYTFFCRLGNWYAWVRQARDGCVWWFALNQMHYHHKYCFMSKGTMWEFWRVFGVLMLTYMSFECFLWKRTTSSGCGASLLSFLFSFHHVVFVIECFG